MFRQAGSLKTGFLVALALAALSASCAGGTESAPAPHEPEDTAATSGALATDGGHLVHVASCGGDPQCVTDVPMTGNASPLFAEVDRAMRTFMKTHCVGSGVLAINYKGRRVYKRGFGRMHGSSMATLPPHCSQDGYVASSDYVLPDADFNIGSVSKFITGSMVRDLVWQRIVDRGLQATYPDPTQALLLDPDLELLPPALLRYLDQTRPDAECPPVAVTDVAGCTRAPGCGAAGPDVRWQQVTVGDLIAHTAGLPTSAPSWVTTVTQAAALRGRDSALDFLSDEHQKVRDATPYKAQLDSARQYLAGKAGVDAADVYFVSPWDRTNPSAAPVDEILTMVAGRCLLAPPNGPAGQSDTSPAGGGPYSNTGMAFVESIITHLHPAGRFAANAGEAGTQGATALQAFLEDEGIESGVQHDFAMFPRDKLVTNPGGPQRRAWDPAQDTYTPLASSWVRPFCIWNGSSCDFSLWSNSSSANDVYRLPVDFATNELTFDPVGGGVVATGKPPLVRFDQRLFIPNPGTGNIAVEAPAILKLAAKYYMGVNDDVRLGRLRATCPECDVTGAKSGGAGGTTARIMTLVGGAKSASLPPQDAYGRLTVEPDTDEWVDTGWTDAADVDFIVSVHQSEDEQGGGSGYGADPFVRYGLSRVDWAAVDRMIQHQRMNVVGVGVNSVGNTYYWFEDEHKSTLGGLPHTHDLTPAAAPPPPPATYDLPSTRVGSDVVAVDIAANNRVYAWYDDGHVSAGNSGNLWSTLPPYEYTVPSGYSYNDIAGIAITSGDTVVSWFKTGKVSFGTSWALGTTLFNFTVPPGQSVVDIVDMAINKANDHTFTVFKDGSVAEGDYYDLDKFSFRPGKVLGMAMQDGDTSIWYLSGYRKDMNGSPADNRLIANVQPTSDYFLLPPGYQYGDVAGVAQPVFFMPRIWFKNGARSTASSGGDFLTAGPPGSTTWPAGDDGNTALSFASHNGVTYSWYNTGHRAQGTDSNLVDVGQWPSYDVPDGQHELLIDAVTIDTGAAGDGDVWTLFRNGAVARGRSWDLADEQYWPSPHINPIP